MADFALCKGDGCDYAPNCYRVHAEPSEERQPLLANPGVVKQVVMGRWVRACTRWYIPLKQGWHPDRNTRTVGDTGEIEAIQQVFP